MNIDTLIHARWIIPLEPEGTVYENYAIAIKDDKIKEILKSNDARKKYTAKEELDLKNHAIIPGLINSHTHAGMSLFRGLANDLPLLEIADKAIVVPSANGPNSFLQKGIDRGDFVLAPAPHSEGWALAVKDLVTRVI